MYQLVKLKNKTMAVNNINIYKSKIEEDLNEGLTWYKKDDLGYGSIQEKYSYKDVQIATIRKHPILKDLETTITVFNIIDDTTGTTTNAVTKSRNDKTLGVLSDTISTISTTQERISTNSGLNVENRIRETISNPEELSDADSASAFANL